MPKAKRTQTPKRAKQEKNHIEAEDEAEAFVESEAPSEAAAEVSVEEENNEAEDTEDVAEVSEGEEAEDDVEALEGEEAENVVEVSEGEELQGADVEETPRRRSRKRRWSSNRGNPISTPNSSQRENREITIAGMIFMCSELTKTDCFKYRVFGFPEEKKDLVMQLKKGMKLFLFDTSQKHLYGIYQASSSGGMNLVPQAFRESDRTFPAQVRFQIYKDCIPLNENEFKEAIKDNYVRKGRFKLELSSQQVRNLIRLFRPLDSEGVPQRRSIQAARRGSASRDVSQQRNAQAARRWPASRDVPQHRNTQAARRGPASQDARRGRSRDSHAGSFASYVPLPALPEPIWHVPRPPPLEPVREPLYPRDPLYSRGVTSLYAREHPLADLDYHRTQPSYSSPASRIALAEAEGRRRYLDDLFLEQTSLLSRRPHLPDPLNRGAEYQREMLPFSSYASRSSGLPY